jgi:hypothetical protein
MSIGMSKARAIEIARSAFKVDRVPQVVYAIGEAYGVTDLPEWQYRGPAGDDNAPRIMNFFGHPKTATMCRIVRRGH